MKTAQEVRANMSVTKNEMHTQSFYNSIKRIEKEIDTAAKENKYSTWIEVAEYNFDEIISFLKKKGYKIYTDSYILSPVLNIKIYKVEVSW